MNASLVSDVLFDPLPPRLKLALLVLAAMADDTGQAHAPIASIARRTGMSEPKTAEAVIELQARGRIERHRAGVNMTASYTVHRRPAPVSLEAQP